MRVIAFPQHGIAYNESFYSALVAEGVSVEEGDFSGRWLYRHVRAGDYLHLHWPSFVYATSRSRAALITSFLRFVALLMLARARGGRLLWTAHNLVPHDRSLLPALDRVGRRLVIGASTRVFVHGAAAADVLVTTYPRVARKLTSIPHGHWVDYYADSVTREEARRRLSLPKDAYVYLFIGLCKPYKNVHRLVEVFRQCGENAVLVIAGAFQEERYRELIVGLAAGDPRIRLYPTFIPDDDMQLFLRACDIVVAPYREILTSGTAMLAMSFGRPVISIAAGHVRDVVTAECGILFDPNDAAGLDASLREARTRCFDESVIIKHARRFTWEDAARIFIRSLSGDGERRPVAVRPGSR
jgi:beta-1,4-mannosyltransferase